MNPQPSPESPQPSATKGANRMPRGKVMFCRPTMEPDDFTMRGLPGHYYPVAVIPCPSIKAARSIVALHAKPASPHSDQQKIAALRGALKSVAARAEGLSQPPGDVDFLRSRLSSIASDARAVLEWIETGDSPNKEGEA